MKTIYKKYLGYLRYLVYHEVRDVLDYPKRFQLHFEILANEQHLKEIFNLYVMNFDHLHPSFEKDVEGAYFREFKKAYYQLMFEKTWLDDVGEIESQHIQCIALILRYANQIKVMTDDLFMSENTIEFKNQDYGVKYDLPFEITSVQINYQILFNVMMSHVLSLYPKTICLKCNCLLLSRFKFSQIRDKKPEPLDILFQKYYILQQSVIELKNTFESNTQQ